ncbi:MAG: GIY-YIG nuclease family protein [Vicingaceae bacterium]
MIIEKHIVYILFSTQYNRFYIGETCDFENRLKQHNSGFYDKSYTKKANDWKQHLLIECESKKQALKIERHIKKMKSVAYLGNLKKYPEIILKLKQKYQ